MSRDRLAAPIVEYVRKRPDPANAAERKKRCIEELRAAVANKREERDRITKQIETTEAEIKRLEAT